MKKDIYSINLCKLCEPFDLLFICYSRYAIVRRNEINPIFHPYYINYGFNKVSFISRLIYDGLLIDELIIH